ncbi:sugar ABC transporter permease [Clostridium sp. chh4-2]|uniref:carbohydrate ABC transporter permease n=1 Tax=Clostridium sp. chh4-2 TaxID=2067550 RepID=UPI000CCEA32E|nr:carbohydrate ABC transporter permease [Clostridium sp. chh4-2]PNV60839.1 sugar ABC transporter permease [Clostridium sp. chh4-2]
MLAKLKMKSKSDIAFDIFNYTLLGAITILVLYPLYFIVIASFSDPDFINTGQVVFWPKGFNVLGYQKIFEDTKIWRAYGNTIFYTLVGTCINIVLTMMFAYPLSRKDFCGRRFLTFFMMFTMYFQGGLMPTYILMQNIHLYDTPWVMVLLPAINVFNVIIAKTNIQNNIPEELYEAAAIDGCSHFKFFCKIVMPLSKSIVAVLVLYYGVAHWNEFMNGLVYLRDEGLYPLQLVLRGILVQNQASADMMADIDSMMAQQKAAELIKYGLIIVSALPVLVIYPFLQKYFAKGVMVGAVKG